MTATLGSEVRLTGVAWIEEGDFVGLPGMKGVGEEDGGIVVAEGFF